MAGEIDKITEAQEHGGIGERPVGRTVVIFFMAYLIIFSGFLLYGILQFWPISQVQPNPAPKEGIPSPDIAVSFLFKTFSVSSEKRTLLIVILSGALGSLVHALRSFYKYVGNKALVWSWLAMYIMLPFVGATLGLVFYLIILGGFFASQSTAQQTNPFGFMALAALAGLFSEQAILKLKTVAETLLSEPETMKNSLPKDENETISKEKPGQ